MKPRRMLGAYHAALGRASTALWLGGEKAGQNEELRIDRHEDHGYEGVPNFLVATV